jgi:hypothetical protein
MQNSGGVRTYAILAGRIALFGALLAPCWWQSRIQAGDLSSHAYNAWLARIAESGQAQGVTVVPQYTNVLFDVLLSALFGIFGPGPAQRIAVTFATLVFLTGAFLFVSAVAGRRAWNILPLIAMLAYGWVFHMGFFNFYLSMGLCLWAMALAWKPASGRVAAAGALYALAVLAHALPVAWSVAVLVYAALARRLQARQRAWAVAVVLAAAAAASAIVQSTMSTRWRASQIGSALGADQVWVYGPKFGAMGIGLLLVWGLLGLNLMRSRGVRGALGDVPFQLAFLTGAGIFVLPAVIFLPGFLHSLAFIAERMSLAAAICICAVVGAARPRLLDQTAGVVLAAVFFVFLYYDERALNRFEDGIEAAVARLEPAQRVVSRVEDPALRVNALAHMIDRACIGRCYSYANYEPSTAQFRVRALTANPFVVSTYEDSWKLQTGTYVVKPADLPIYAVDVDGAGRVGIGTLKAGEQCGSTHWKVLPDLFSDI